MQNRQTENDSAGHPIYRYPALSFSVDGMGMADASGRRNARHFAELCRKIEKKRKM